MAEDAPSWAELDEDWARKEARAEQERAANLAAELAGEPLPYPNLWDQLDPTKLAPGEDTPEARAQRRQEFRRRCRTRPRKRHVLWPTSSTSSTP